MRRRSRAIWRTVLPFTLSFDAHSSLSPAALSRFVVSFFIPIPLSRSPTRRPRYVYRSTISTLAAITMFALGRVELLQAELLSGCLRTVAFAAREETIDKRHQKVKKLSFASNYLHKNVKCEYRC